MALPQPTEPEEEPREEDRATVAPPLPSKEYVKRMMQLGELDDPSPSAPTDPAEAPRPRVTGRETGGAAQRPRAPGLAAVWDREATPPRGLPAMASEQEMMEQSGTKAWTDEPVGSVPARSAAGVPRLAPLQHITDLDTLDGLGPVDTLDGVGPLDPDLFEGAWATGLVGEPGRSTPSPPGLGGGRAVAREIAARHHTPTGMRIRTGGSFDDLRVDDLIDSGAPPGDDASPDSFDRRVRDMRALLSANNYSSALVVAESVLLADPSHAVARSAVASCQSALCDKYLASLGGRGAVPRVRMNAEELRWLSLDHRSGFLLALVDGSTCVDDLLDVSSMTELDALRILFELRTQGVIDVAEPARKPSRR